MIRRKSEGAPLTMQTSLFLSQFFTVAVVHLLAVMSPGPDFALVLKESVSRGRRDGILSAIGIGLGLSVHITYSLLGIGLIIAHSIVAFTVLKIIGALYLVFIGVGALRSKPRSELDALPPEHSQPKSVFAQLGKGFLTNGLNPKATLFFLALFSVVINPATPLTWKLSYGLWMIIATIGWFTVVATCFSTTRVRTLFLTHRRRSKYTIDRLKIQIERLFSSIF